MRSPRPRWGRGWGRRGGRGGGRARARRPPPHPPHPLSFQADALVTARGRYLEALEAASAERARLKAVIEANEPSRDTFGARSLRQLSAASAVEAFAGVVEVEDRAALDLELAAVDALRPPQYAVAFLAAGPSLPDWLCVANLLAADPGRGGDGAGSGSAAGGPGGSAAAPFGGPGVADAAAEDARRADAAAGGAAARVV